MSVSSERGPAKRAANRSRSSSGRSGASGAARRSGAAGATRNGTNARAGTSARAATSARSVKSESSQRGKPSANGSRATITNVGISVASAAIGVAGGVLLGRSALQRNRKVLGIPLPNKIDLSGLSAVGSQIGEAGRQFGKLAGEIRTTRERAERVGRALG